MTIDVSLIRHSTSPEALCKYRLCFHRKHWVTVQLTTVRAMRWGLFDGLPGCWICLETPTEGLGASSDSPADSFLSLNPIIHSVRSKKSDPVKPDAHSLSLRSFLCRNKL